MKTDISSELIKLANKKAASEFMDFPDYDKKNPITSLEEALTVLMHDELDELEPSEVYDFLKETLNT